SRPGMPWRSTLVRLATGPGAWRGRPAWRPCVDVPSVCHGAHLDAAVARHLPELDRVCTTRAEPAPAGPTKGVLWPVRDFRDRPQANDPSPKVASIGRSAPDRLRVSGASGRSAPEVASHTRS